MRAWIFHGPGDLRLEDVEPGRPGPGEVAVSIKAAATCGTDLKSFRRGHPTLFPELPARFGHEFAGVVSEVGEGVDRFAVGQRVVAANTCPCGACWACQIGRESLCENLQYLNGAFAEQIQQALGQRMVRFGQGDFFAAAADQAGLAQAAQLAIEGIAGHRGDGFQFMDVPGPAQQQLDQGQTPRVRKRGGDGSEGVVSGVAPEGFLDGLQERTGGGNRSIGHGAIAHEKPVPNRLQQPARLDSAEFLAGPRQADIDLGCQLRNRLVGMSHDASK